MVLKFIKNCPPYVLNDIAGINDKLAKKLIDGKYAVEYKEESENDAQESTEENVESEKQPEQTEIDIPKDEEKPKQNKNSKK